MTAAFLALGIPLLVTTPAAADSLPSCLPASTDGACDAGNGWINPGKGVAREDGAPTPCGLSYDEDADRERVVTAYYYKNCSGVGQCFQFKKDANNETAAATVRGEDYYGMQQWLGSSYYYWIPNSTHVDTFSKGTFRIKPSAQLEANCLTASGPNM